MPTFVIFLQLRFDGAAGDMTRRYGRRIVRGAKANEGEISFPVDAEEGFL
ncbi:hypothetical protein SLT36_02445 [Aminobacter sp. BA135]